MTLFESILQAIIYHFTLIVGSITVLALLVFVWWGLVEYILKRLGLTKEVAIWVFKRYTDRQKQQEAENA